MARGRGKNNNNNNNNNNNRNNNNNTNNNNRGGWNGGGGRGGGNWNDENNNFGLKDWQREQIEQNAIKKEKKEREKAEAEGDAPLAEGIRKYAGFDIHAFTEAQKASIHKNPTIYSTESAAADLERINRTLNPRKPDSEDEDEDAVEKRENDDPRLEEDEQFDTFLNCYATSIIRAIRPELLNEADTVQLGVIVHYLFGWPERMKNQQFVKFTRGSKVYMRKTSRKIAWRNELNNKVVEEIKKYYYSFNVFEIDSVETLITLATNLPASSKALIRKLALGMDVFRVEPFGDPIQSCGYRRKDGNVFALLTHFPNLQIVQVHVGWDFEEERLIVAKLICDLMEHLIEFEFALGDEGDGRKLVGVDKVKFLKRRMGEINLATRIELERRAKQRDNDRQRGQDAMQA